MPLGGLVMIIDLKYPAYNTVENEELVSMEFGEESENAENVLCCPLFRSLWSPAVSALCMDQEKIKVLGITLLIIIDQPVLSRIAFLTKVR